MKRLFALITVIFLATASSLSAGQVATLTKSDVPSLFGDLCKSNVSEPACKAINLSEDEQWLVLRAACASAPLTDSICKTFIQQQGGVLAYDVVAKRWTAAWEGRTLDLDFDVAGVPTLRLQRGEAKPLKVIVTSISPLSYSASPGTPKEDDLSIMADLKSFLPLVGAVIGTSFGKVEPRVPPFSVTKSQGKGVSEKSSDPGFNALWMGNKDEVSSALTPPTCAIQAPDVAGIAEVVSSRHEQLALAGSSLGKLGSALKNLESTRDQFVAAAQRAEYGATVAISDLARPDIVGVKTAYANFEANLQPLRTGTATLTACYPMLSTYSGLLTGPSDPSFIATMATTAGAHQCGNSALLASVKENVKRLVEGMYPTCTSTEVDTALKLHKAAMLPFVDRLLTAQKTEEVIWKAIDAATSGQRDILRGADVLDQKLRVSEMRTWKGVVVNELIVTRPNPVLPWSKVQSHSVVVKVDSPYQKDLTLTQPTEAKYEYKLESMTGSILGYGIGMSYTPLYESTWTAVSVPGGTTKLIGETKREGRAGHLAAFINYRFAEHRKRKSAVRPTLDFGVGLDTDNPAFFVGAGFEIKKAARLGFGWSPQRVNQLAQGQVVGETVVTSNDDIRTAKRFDTKNWYISVAFALDSLSLFSAK